MSTVVPVAFDDFSLPMQWTSGAYASSNLITVLGIEGPGQALHVSDGDQYSDRDPDLSPNHNSDREPDYGPINEPGSIVLAGQNFIDVDRQQHHKTNSLLTELIQTCVIRQSQLTGFCARPELSLEKENFPANTPGADCRADTQLPILPNLNQKQINVRAS